MKKTIAFLILLSVCAFAKDPNRFLYHGRVALQNSACIIDIAQAQDSFGQRYRPATSDLVSIGEAIRLQELEIVRPIGHAYTGYASVTTPLVGTYGQSVSERIPSQNARLMLHVLTANKQACWTLEDYLGYAYLDTVTGKVYAFKNRRRPKHEKDLKNGEYVTTEKL